MKISPANTMNATGDITASLVDPTKVISNAPAGIQPMGDTGLDAHDADISWVERAMPMDVGKEAFYPSSDNNDGTIYDFLARPIQVVSGTLAATDVASTFGFFDSSVVMGANTMWNEKLKGKYAIKYDVRLKLIVNADRFQAGRYILAGVPMGGDSGTSVASSWYRMHRHSKVQITQLPHVEIDINSQTEVELVLPWVNGFAGVPLAEALNADSTGNPWAFFLYPYWPLITSGGSSTASYSIFMSLENVKLGIPAIPQAGIDNIAAEQRQAKVGPVSSFLNRVSQSFNILSEIPLLSALASPTAWGSDILSKAANVWGWSSPSNLQPIERVRQDPHGYMMSGDAVNNATTMSLFSRNHVKVLPGFGGTNADELAIDYLKSIMSYRTGFLWEDTAATGTALYNGNVDPTVSVTTTEPGGNLVNLPTVAFLCTMFRLWRGSLTFRFKFVSTMFHSGRLMIVYNPRFSQGSHHGVGASIANSSYAYREIIDLREKKECTITLPFVNATPWRAMSDGATGVISVIVLDALVHPATVSSTVPVLVEVCGGPDFEVSIPIKSSGLVPVIPYTMQMDMPAPDNSIIKGTIGGSSVVTDRLWNCESCIGEKVSSLRTLLKRYTTLGTTGQGNGHAQISPQMIDCAHSGIASIQNPDNYADDYNTIAPLYLFSRGGFRFKFIDITNSAATGSIRADHYWTGNDIYSSVVSVPIGTLTRNGGPWMEFNSGLTGSAEFQVPMYHHTYVRSNVSAICNRLASVGPNTSDIGPARPFYVLDYGYNPAAQSIWYYRAAADDFNLGCFVSVPPYCTPQT